ncbi:PaaI family thioesterase [Shimia aestuarii]|uniref:PaaI family thioesterase n=1 Tax=Shimia aestuarii TaxID=254406 RepID=UPI000B84AB72|nr:PaaI family thioesterase [Shimia aestuarii]
MSREIAAKVEQSFANQAMMTTFGARLTRLAHGMVEIEAPILEQCTQQHGFGHAALTFGLGDSAAGYAALSVMPPEAEVLTSEMKIHLLSPAHGDLLRATGKVVKPGRRLVIVQAEVHAISGDLTTQIALMTGTMVPVFPK